ncbi:pseudaminic acid cytidylyltransferase [Glaciecola sp. SC05]|uniref:pseudaminic acid cytidylyltransferase n=1 Tax=Glaciecola sp. SC05 TaxID=1987355 RepID=UPI003528AACA
MKFALIPARGGSKRIANKNIRLFNGKPIIAYSIETAIASNLFDQIIVSTDCPDIAAIAEQYGANVPFLRPENISGDHASTVEVIQHAITFMQARYDDVTHCCCIYATAPFLTVQHLTQARDALLLQSTSVSSKQSSIQKSFAFSVTEFPFPVQRALKITNGNIQAMYPEYRSTRSQDLSKAYHDAGQFYWGTCEGFLSEKPVFSEHSIPIILPAYLVQDIDTPDDWTQAELMHQALQLKLNASI